MLAGGAQQQHPAWCNELDGPCGNHLSAPITIPAGAGHWYRTENGVLLPRVDVAAAYTRHGERGVYLGLPDLETGRWVSGIATLPNARAVAAGITAQADLAESRWAWR